MIWRMPEGNLMLFIAILLFANGLQIRDGHRTDLYYTLFGICLLVFYEVVRNTI
jgi:hypothetical protein